MTTATLPARGELHYDPKTRRAIHVRACDRCGHPRQVRKPNAKRNLCGDCRSVLSPAEAARWAA